MENRLDSAPPGWKKKICKNTNLKKENKTQGGGEKKCFGGKKKEKEPKLLLGDERGR